MRRVYLAGPIEHVGKDYATIWRKRAKQAGERLGIGVIDPTFFDGAPENLSAGEVVIRDTYLLQQADAILADCRAAGWGTAMEILRAYQDGKLVVGWGAERKSLFLVHHVAKFVDTPEEGISYISDLLDLMQ